MRLGLAAQARRRARHCNLGAIVAETSNIRELHDQLLHDATYSSLRVTRPIRSEMLDDQLALRSAQHAADGEHDVHTRLLAPGQTVRAWLRPDAAEMRPSEPLLARRSTERRGQRALDLTVIHVVILRPRCQRRGELRPPVPSHRCLDGLTPTSLDVCEHPLPGLCDLGRKPDRLGRLLAWSPAQLAETEPSSVCMATARGVPEVATCRRKRSGLRDPAVPPCKLNRLRLRITVHDANAHAVDIDVAAAAPVVPASHWSRCSPAR